MNMPDDFSVQCSRLFYGVQQTADLPNREFCRRCGFPERHWQTFRRLLLGQRKSGWSEAKAEQVAATSSCLIDLPFNVIWDYLHGHPVEPEYLSRLREVELAHRWLPRSNTALVLRHKIEEYEQRAKQITGIQQFLPASLTDQGIYKPYYHNLTANLGQLGRRVRTVIWKFTEERRQRFLKHGPPASAHSRVLIMLSQFEQAMAMKGMLRGTAPDAIREFLISLIDTIEHTDYEIVLIRDDLLPSRIAEYYARYDGIVAFDHAFVMKIHHGGMVRSWCEGQLGTAYATHLSFDLQNAAALLKYQLPLTKQQLIEKLKRYLPPDSST